MRRIDRTVLRLLAEAPDEDHYAYELMKGLGVLRGLGLYPALDRLERAGLIMGIWKERPSSISDGVWLTPARPKRRTYQINSGVVVRESDLDLPKAPPTRDAVPIVIVPRAFLEQFVEGGECRYDHHDTCQAHFSPTIEPGQCAQVRLKELLSRD